MTSEAIPTASAWPSEYVKRFVERVLQDACELGDYTSPEGNPELLQMTCSQLEGLVEGAFEALPPSVADLATTAREHEAAGDARVIAMREAAKKIAGDAIPCANPPRGNSYGDHVAGERYAAERILQRLIALPLPKPTDALAAVVAEAKQQGAREELNACIKAAFDAAFEVQERTGEGSGKHAVAISKALHARARARGSRAEGSV
jgi:hypothetical protein